MPVCATMQSRTLDVRRSNEEKFLTITALPSRLLGRAQIVALIFIAEVATEAKKPHYMMGGKLPEVVFPQIDFSNVDKATFKIQRTKELNNGRLAMIAIASFISEYYVPGSVPALTGLDAF